jgi:hypothetical protein
MYAPIRRHLKRAALPVDAATVAQVALVQGDGAVEVGVGAAVGTDLHLRLGGRPCQARADGCERGEEASGLARPAVGFRHAAP